MNTSSSWKTTIAGLVAGLPTVLAAILDAYQQGQFTGKSALQVATGIGIIVIGLLAKDFNITGGNAVSNINNATAVQASNITPVASIPNPPITTAP